MRPRTRAAREIVSVLCDELLCIACSAFNRQIQETICLNCSASTAMGSPQSRVFEHDLGCRCDFRPRRSSKVARRPKAARFKIRCFTSPGGRIRAKCKKSVMIWSRPRRIPTCTISSRIFLRFGHFQRARDLLHRAANRGQRVADFVRDGGRNVAHRLDAMALLVELFHLLFGGDVVERDIDHAFGLRSSSRIGDRIQMHLQRADPRRWRAA